MTRSARLAIIPNDAAMARLYGLPKVRKDGAPLRPIVSVHDTPIINQTKWMFRRLNPVTLGSDTTVRLATDFLEKLTGLQLEIDDIIILFDVTLLSPRSYRAGPFKL
ncbi:unnamed protein product [Dibothriocephalus latus]|uniref:Uncharacterized protein n=1 Tax=Dibothriocephalus latus TaxID=60516 RepID=A0A3P6UAX0_DIBLA|nr:unnamed protein product [Dibothriocephalus latus]